MYKGTTKTYTFIVPDGLDLKPKMELILQVN